MEEPIAIPQEISIWLQQFACCVRDRAYEEARPLFDEGVYSFGTVAYRAEGLDDLISSQWRQVWDDTQGFDFDYNEARGWQETGLACVALAWSSAGKLSQGKKFERRGRATIILRRVDGTWKAVHSHFSMNP